MDYGNTKTPSMHQRLGNATLSQLAFPREGNPNFPWVKSHWDNTVVKEVFLKETPLSNHQYSGSSVAHVFTVLTENINTDIKMNG